MEKYTAPGVEQGDFGAFGILKLTMGSLLFVLSVPIIVALATARTIAKGSIMIRVHLMSALLFACIILSGLIALVTVYLGAPPPPTQYCGFH